MAAYGYAVYQKGYKNGCYLVAIISVFYFSLPFHKL